MPPVRYSGESTAAQYVGQELIVHHRYLQKSSALGIERLLRVDLPELWDDCGESDWDGFGAHAVNVETYRNAEQFLRALPYGAPVPSVGAEPDGQITFEWYQSRRRVLSVSISADGELHYAALLGPNSSRGKEAFFEEVPIPILRLIHDVFAC